MKHIILFALVATAAASVGQAVNTTITSAGGSFTARAGSYTTGTGTAISGLADFTCNGVTGDYAFRDMWAYRQTGDTREYMATDATATFTLTSPSTFHVSMLKSINNLGPATIRLDIDYRIFANSPTSPVLERCMTITNLTGGTIDFSMFHYADYDIPGGGADNVTRLASPAGSELAEQHDIVNPANYAQTYFAGVGGPLRYRHGALYASLFTNATIDDLNNSVTAGSGDFGMGFELSATLAPFQTSVCPGCYTALNGSAVPEPGSLAGIGLGLLVVLRRRARK